ncbi:thioesterase [Amycolatopsis antarctica]|uniref:Thioesterase n=1 Tax=Amycolatopsis antarctica TaxID=1854586 RepID=A0A263D420_9PSEU|nr:thioesterase family protein [Amycolatopsis antarctica]OZM72959.1 thioesterase [Amycolatopsis antarctica]
MTSETTARGGFEFDTDTGVRPAGGGGFTATVADRWQAIGGTANGGYLLGVTVRALCRVSPLPDPLVVSAFFLRAGVAGPARIGTELVRAGRRLATVQGGLRQDGREVLRAVATFTDFDAARGPTVLRNAPPALPVPEVCVDPVAGMGLPEGSVAHRVEYRVPEVTGWWRGVPSGEPSAEFWMRFRDGRDADLPGLTMLVDAAAPAVMELGAAGSLTVELTVHLRARPAPGWLACRVSTRHVIDGYHEEDFEVWDSTGILVAQARQLALLAG